MSKVIQLFIDKIQAGFPSPAEGYMAEELDLNKYLIDHPISSFFVRVSGNSMIGAGIFENDILVVDKSLSPANGKIVIAIINCEFTVKRLLFKGNKIYLVAENKDYEPIVFDKENNWADNYIWGVVTSVIRKL